VWDKNESNAAGMEVCGNVGDLGSSGGGSSTQDLGGLWSQPGIGKSNADEECCALYVFASKGSVPGVRMILNNPTMRTTHGYSQALQVAACEGKLEIVRLLLSDGRADPNAEEGYCLSGACIHGHNQVVETLLQDRRLDPRVGDSVALFEATKYGHVDIVETLLVDGRADPSTRHSWALYVACRDGNSKAVQLLLKDGRSDPSAEKSHSLQACVSRGHLECVQLLMLDGRCDPIASDSLLLACQEGFHEIVSVLLKDDRVAQHKNYSIGLQLAAQEGYYKVVDLLLQHANVDPAADKSYPLVAACVGGFSRVVELLLKDKRAVPATWCLYNAASVGHSQIVKLLLDDQRVNFGNTSSEWLEQHLPAMDTQVLKILVCDDSIKLNIGHMFQASSLSIQEHAPKKQSEAFLRCQVFFGLASVRCGLCQRHKANLETCYNDLVRRLLVLGRLREKIGRDVFGLILEQAGDFHLLKYFTPH